MKKKTKTILEAYDELSLINGEFKIQLFNLKVLERLMNDGMSFTYEDLDFGEYAVFVEKQLEKTIKNFEERLEDLFEAYKESRGLNDN